MILEKIFSGNLYPAEEVIIPEEELKANESEIYKIMSHFEETLPQEEYLLLEKLADHYAHREFSSNKAQFIFGFRLGAQIMQEIFQI